MSLLSRLEAAKHPANDRRQHGCSRAMTRCTGLDVRLVTITGRAPRDALMCVECRDAATALGLVWEYAPAIRERAALGRLPAKAWAA